MPVRSASIGGIATRSNVCALQSTIVDIARGIDVAQSDLQNHTLRVGATKCIPFVYPPFGVADGLSGQRYLNILSCGVGSIFSK